MTTLYHYRLWCTTENTYVYTWAETAPTTCPNDTAHTVDANSLTVVGRRDVPLVTIQDGVQGYYQSGSIRVPIPATTPGDIYNHDVTFPFSMWLWTCEFDGLTDAVGDEFSIIIAPNSMIGVLTAPASIGDTVLNVYSTVFTCGYVTHGVDLTITDGTNTQSLGRVVTFDQTAGTITMETALTNNYSPGISQILLNLNIVRKQFIGVDGKTYRYGKKGFATRAIPQGSVMRFQYVNNNGLAKTLNFDLEYNYA